jgi:hypothetical protein
MARSAARGDYGAGGASRADAQVFTGPMASTRQHSMLSARLRREVPDVISATFHSYTLGRDGPNDLGGSTIRRSLVLIG